MDIIFKWGVGVCWMRKRTEIIGLPVINLKTGEEIAEVDDLVFSPEYNEINGIIVKNENKYFIHTHNIYGIGEDAVIINDINDLEDINKLRSIETESQGVNIIGEKVLSKSGKEVGVINDIIIDEDNIKLLGYELSEGLVQDILEGRNFLSINKNITYGKDTIILSD
jgi:uncharacterized protein YrrD